MCITCQNVCRWALRTCELCTQCSGTHQDTSIMYVHNVCLCVQLSTIQSMYVYSGTHQDTSCNQDTPFWPIVAQSVYHVPELAIMYVCTYACVQLSTIQSMYVYSGAHQDTYTLLWPNAILSVYYLSVGSEQDTTYVSGHSLVVSRTLHIYQDTPW